MHRSWYYSHLESVTCWTQKSNLGHELRLIPDRPHTYTHTHIHTYTHTHIHTYTHTHTHIHTCMYVYIHRSRYYSHLESVARLDSEIESWARATPHSRSFILSGASLTHIDPTVCVCACTCGDNLIYIYIYIYIPRYVHVYVYV